MLARWTALTRWLIAEGAPLDITAAASEMVAGTRRKLRGAQTRLYRNGICNRIRYHAYNALAAWKSCGEPGFGTAVKIVARQLTNERLLARTQG